MSGKDMFTPPKRNSVLIEKLDSTPTSPPLRDLSMYPWNWGEGAHTVDLSPASSCGGGSTSSSPESEADRLKRGRPRAENITNLMMEGTKAESNIRCNICNRVFPREKSLQAHMRTHTGERPYVCDYPSCGRAFCQSGQLKTHQRLHTGEKPFICSVEGCDSRFTHANRHCIDHPMVSLKRDENPPISIPSSKNSKHGQAIELWFQKYLIRRQERPSPARPSPSAGRPRKTSKRSLQQDIENQHRSPLKRTEPHSPNAKRLLQPRDLMFADNCGVRRLEQLEDEEPKKDEQDRLLGALALVQLAQGNR